MDAEDVKKTILLQTRQLASQACKRLQEVIRSTTLLFNAKPEDMPKWKRDALARAEQHLVNCARTFEQLTNHETTEDLDVVQKAHVQNMNEQHIPPFKSKLRLEAHEHEARKHDIKKLLKQFGTSEREVNVFF